MVLQHRSNEMLVVGALLYIEKIRIYIISRLTSTSCTYEQFEKVNLDRKLGYKTIMR